jgi:hypothetical protein
MIESIFLFLGVPVVVTTCPIMKAQGHSKMKISPDGSSRDVCR